MFLFIFLALLAYLTIGTQISRTIHAQRRHAIESNPEWTTYQRKKAELLAMAHESSCYMGSDWHKDPLDDSRTCDCSTYGTYKNNAKDFRELRQSMYASMPASTNIPNPYIMVAGWPLLGYHSYLTGGKVDKPNYAKIQELEIANGFKELEEV